MSISKLKAELRAALERNDGDHTSREVCEAKRAVRTAQRARRAEQGRKPRAYYGGAG